MQPISTPLRSITSTTTCGPGLSTPVGQSRRFNISFSAPTEKQRRVEGNNSTFVMSNSSGKTKTNSRRFDTTQGSFHIDDEESVLVASPFSYVTPPMPPREEVSNTKTTKAMAKIVEEEGTPDSVIRKLSFMNQPGNSDNSSSFDELAVPGTVNRASRMVRSVDSGDPEEDSFRFPIVTPSQEMSRVEMEQVSPSEGFSRFSLSMVDLYPPQSPKVLRQAQGMGGSSEPSTVPDLLTNCDTCGKQFISVRHLEDHSDFCRPADARGRMGDSEASTLAQTTDKAGFLVSSFSINKEHKNFLESPALPLYVQRAHSSLPAVAPLPLPASPSILASPPTDLRESNEEDFLEEEISTFLECLRSDVRNEVVQDIEKEDKKFRLVLQPMSSGSSSEGSSSVPITERQREWASRRAKSRGGNHQHSLCVSSDDDDPQKSVASQSYVGATNRLVLAPVIAPPQLPPPVPMSSNVSVNSPIPQRASFEQETSLTSSFLTGPVASVVAKYVSPAATAGGRSSPNFGFRASIPFSVSDSSVTLLRLSRLPCGSCGRKFATASRLEKHEAVCQQVFGDVKRPSFDSSRQRSTSVSEEIVPSIEQNASTVACKYCSRYFSHADKLSKHEHICLSVFKGRKRSKSPSAASARTHSFSQDACRIGVSISETGTVAHKQPQPFKRNNLKLHAFTAAVVLPAPSSIKRTNLVSVSTQYEHAVSPMIVHPRSRPATIDSSSYSSVLESTSSASSVNRTSLEFQYQLLREQIRSCSEKLKQRRVHACVRDG